MNCLRPRRERADEAAHDLLYSLSSDYVWQRGIKMLMDSYVVGFNGVTAATYSSRQFNYDAVLADPRYEPLFSGTQDALLVPTTTHPEATGIFVHSFQYAQLIRDHLTQEPLGVVILNISEVSLYFQYLRHQSADNRFFRPTGRAPLSQPGTSSSLVPSMPIPRRNGRPGGGDVPLPPH